MKSDYLSNSGLRALSRIGDILCPGDHEFPSYSETGCIEHVDRMLATVPPADMKDLGLLLSVLSFTPGFFLRWLVTQMAKTDESTSTLSGLFRMLDFGLRGIIFGTYYSGFVGADF
ncbi:MAG: hypothetical protein JKX84_00060 [Flavobacteriales bacterium]|nr:hypothetical protein [Flavobacteriales bacterium]